MKLMPVTKSAIARVKTNEIAKARRTAQLSEERTAVKKFEKAVTAGADNVEELYRSASAAIDHAYSKGLIKKNKASRDKSRLAARLAK
ncbi:hypothetical protein FD35_GL000079 [Furfurilactobacillus rossiae DSM 15814]|uniref:Small ribosomal subunit protein bS20 n=2 Tax=Furfurilactobacillus TaxID=2767882 RepID=A0A0R1RKS6_9LACO|nr:hypothetical protein FD35_GL000079 [Furfurilactobacillus rossiae DSM 15814]